MKYIEEKPMSDLLGKLLDYCYSDNKSKLTAKDVLFNFMDCMVDHTIEDVQPIKHGRWKKPATKKFSVYTGDCFCSECESRGLLFWNYCCVCGAKMDKE